MKMEQKLNKQGTKTEGTWNKMEQKIKRFFFAKI